MGLAADKHRLHADREGPGRYAHPVVAHHALGLDDALRLLHGGRVEHRELPQRCVDLLHGIASALAGPLVPPQEVDGSARQVGRRAALPHVQLPPAPLRVCGRGDQEVAQPLVRAVPYQGVYAVSVEHLQAFQSRQMSWMMLGVGHKPADRRVYNGQRPRGPAARPRDSTSGGVPRYQPAVRGFPRGTGLRWAMKGGARHESSKDREVHSVLQEGAGHDAGRPRGEARHQRPGGIQVGDGQVHAGLRHHAGALRPPGHQRQRAPVGREDHGRGVRQEARGEPAGTGPAEGGEGQAAAAAGGGRRLHRLRHLPHAGVHGLVPGHALLGAGAAHRDRERRVRGGHGQRGEDRADGRLLRVPQLRPPVRAVIQQGPLGPAHGPDQGRCWRGCARSSSGTGSCRQGI